MKAAATYAPVSKERWLRLRPAGSPEASHYLGQPRQASGNQPRGPRWPRHAWQSEAWPMPGLLSTGVRADDGATDDHARRGGASRVRVRVSVRGLGSG